MMFRFHRSASSLPEARLRPWSGTKKIVARCGEEKGQSMVEFALVFPILMAVLMGIIAFGIVFWNQITLTNAANNAAQAIMSGVGGGGADPCASANTAFYYSAPSLNNKNIYGSNPLTFSITAYTASGSASSTGNQVVFSAAGGPSCKSLSTSLTQGYEVVVNATYGCNLQLFGFNPAPNCKLTAQTAEAVQ